MDNNVDLLGWTYKNILPQICGLYYNGIINEIIIKYVAEIISSHRN